jgi:hypothetical protein
MLNKICKISFISAILASPVFALAQLGQTNMILKAVQFAVTDTLIPIVFTLGLLLFFWGVVKYIWSEGNGKEEGKKFMIWGVIALFVMSSVWGIIRFVQGEIPGLGNNSSMPIPKIGQ